MSRHIPDSLREFVFARAAYRCEYCLLPMQVAGFVFEVDHVIALKHRGTTHPDNLASSCPICNGRKGSDVGTLIQTGRQTRFVRFFNPRKDKWATHFKIEDGQILPKTSVGLATSLVFDFNRPEDVECRKMLQSIGLYPK
ncbi:MAG: HNH endonuclease [Saprospiraceae bacterium]